MKRTNQGDNDVLASLGRQTINNAWFTASPPFFTIKDDTLVLELDDGREIHVRAYAPHEDASLYLEEFVPE